MAGSIEESKKEVEKAAKWLSRKIQDAEENIAALRRQEEKAKRRVDVAKKRLDIIKKMTFPVLCDECRSLLPALSVASRIDPSPGHCAACGEPWPESRARVVINMPPSSTDALKRSLKARTNAKKVAQSKNNQRRRRSCSSSSSSSESSSDSSSDSSSRCDGDCGRSQVTRSWKCKKKHVNADKAVRSGSDYLSKKKSIALASEYVENAERKLEGVTFALKQWQKYVAQHRTEATELNSAKSNAEHREREMLLDRLAELGCSPGPAPPSSSQCSICLENPKEIVFGCGHQCCSKCSSKLQACHMCRKNVRKRIRLFHD